MVRSKSQLQHSSLASNLSVFIRVVFPVLVVLSGIFVHIYKKMKSGSWGILCVEFGACVFFGVRWLSKQIMYLSSSHIMNRIVLREETEYLYRLLNKACNNISKGVDYLREDQPQGYYNIRRGKTVLDSVKVILGDDLPLSKLPLLEETVSLLDALVPILESRTSDEQLTAVESRVSSLRSIMKYHLSVPPSFSTFSSCIRHVRFWSAFWSFIRPKNPFFVTFPMLQRRLALETNCDVLSVPTPDHQSISCFVFPPQCHTSHSQHFVLIASPNACVAECSYRNDSLVQFYTLQGYHVVVYNYRGTGASTGSVSPWNTVSDAETISRFVYRKYRITPDIVHGTSIGGFVVSQFPDETHLLVYDRTFCDMNSLVYCYVHPLLAFLVKVCRRWPMNNLNSFNFQRNSILIFDPQDEIVSFPVSLVVGITNKYAKPDSDVQKIESIFGKGVKVARALLEELEGANQLQELENCSDETLLDIETLSPPQKIACLFNRCYVLGIPLNLLFFSSPKVDVSFLVRFIMTWRHHVTSFHSRGNDIHLLMDAIKRPDFVSCTDRSMNPLTVMIRCMNDCLSRDNVVLPDRIQALAVHCGHNGVLSPKELAFLGEMIENSVSESRDQEE